MKNKWLIILCVLFLAVILFSLLIAQQSQKVSSLTEEEILTAGQERIKFLSSYSAPATQAPIAPLPLVRRGITIIQPLSVAPEGKSMIVPRVADKASNNITNFNASSSTENPDPLQMGIAKTGKQPTSKEAKEMNSAGIVMY